LDGSKASPDLQIGETNAYFQEFGTVPEIKELLKCLANGATNSSKSSRSSSLFTPSGPDALPVGRDLK